MDLTLQIGGQMRQQAGWRRKTSSAGDLTLLEATKSYLGAVGQLLRFYSALAQSFGFNLPARILLQLAVAQGSSCSSFVPRVLF